MRPRNVSDRPVELLPFPRRSVRIPRHRIRNLLTPVSAVSGTQFDAEFFQLCCSLQPSCSHRRFAVVVESSVSVEILAVIVLAIVLNHDSHHLPGRLFAVIQNHSVTNFEHDFLQCFQKQRNHEPMLELVRLGFEPRVSFVNETRVAVVSSVRTPSTLHHLTGAGSRRLPACLSFRGRDLRRAAVLRLARCLWVFSIPLRDTEQQPTPPVPSAPEQTHGSCT
jgi:hypothetical protein